MATLADLTSVLRSKNAGALLCTLDLMSMTKPPIAGVRDSGVLTPELIAELYGISHNEVAIIPYDVAYAIKITIPGFTRRGRRAIPTSTAPSSMDRCSPSRFRISSSRRRQRMRANMIFENLDLDGAFKEYDGKVAGISERVLSDDMDRDARRGKRTRLPAPRPRACRPLRRMRMTTGKKST